MMAERLTRVWSSNPGPAKFYTALQAVRHRFNIYASRCAALALWLRDGHCKLVRRFGLIRRVKWKVWYFWHC